MDFVPEFSAIKTDHIEVDKETIDMLASLGMADLPGLVEMTPETIAPVTVPGAFGRGAGGPRRY